MLLNWCIIIKDFILPVCINRIIGNFFCRITRSIAIINLHFIHDCHIFLGIQNSFLLPRILPTITEIIVYSRFSLAARLGSHQNHTVGCTGTINSSRSSIFQDFNRSNIRRVQIVDTTAHRHTIDNVQGVGTIYRTDTTNTNLRIRIRLTGRLCNLYAGNFTFQSIFYTGRLHQVQFIRIYFADSRCHYTFFLNTVTYNHHFVQRLCILYQCYFKRSSSIYSHFLWLKSYISKGKRCIGRSRQCEIAIQVSNSTIGSTFNYHIYSGQRFIVRTTDHCTFYLYILGIYRSQGKA